MAEDSWIKHNHQLMPQACAISAWSFLHVRCIAHHSSQGGPRSKLHCCLEGALLDIGIFFVHFPTPFTCSPYYTFPNGHFSFFIKHRCMVPQPCRPHTQCRIHHSYSVKFHAFRILILCAYEALWVCHWEYHLWVHHLGFLPLTLAYLSSLLSRTCVYKLPCLALSKAAHFPLICVQLLLHDWLAMKHHLSIKHPFISSVYPVGVYCIAVTFWLSHWNTLVCGCCSTGKILSLLSDRITDVLQ